MRPALRIRTRVMQGSSVSAQLFSGRSFQHPFIVVSKNLVTSVMDEFAKAPVNAQFAQTGVYAPRDLLPLENA
jgi:hypothetical protein